MNCSVYVTKRNYGAPGPCENAREVRATYYNGEEIAMCAPHRAMAYRGQALTLHKDITVAEHKRLVAQADSR